MVSQSILLVTIIVLAISYHISNSISIKSLKLHREAKKTSATKMSRKTSKKGLSLTYMIKSFFVTIIDPSYVQTEIGGNFNLKKTNKLGKTEEKKKFKKSRRVLFECCVFQLLFYTLFNIFSPHGGSLGMLGSGGQSFGAVCGPNGCM